jgi:nicotinamidase-related amidase
VDRIDASRCQLVLVDFQARLMPAIDGGDRVLATALRLAQAARRLDVPVLATEHNPRALGPNADALRQHCASALSKMHFDACEDGLTGSLQAIAERPEVVIAGCESHVCLLQTALGLLRAGRRVWVVADACGSRRAVDHALAMQRLRDAGAIVVGAEMVMFEWVHDCRHRAFREVLALIKQG